MNATDNNDVVSGCTMQETVYLTTGELEEQIGNFLGTSTLTDKKWIYNYFSGHEKWPIITDELD